METSTRQLQTREVSSRYRSPTPTPVASSVSRISPSPTVTRSATSNISVSKRSISSERRRASCQSSPSTPPSSTPGKDTAAEHHLALRKGTSNRLAESLWPSTMRSLSVSFQFDSYSVPVGKREKTVSHGISDRTLRPSCNVGQKQNDTPPSSRKPTPETERKRSPLKGKNSENSQPVEGVHLRLVEQHRWPSRTGGKVSSKVLNSSTDKAGRMSCSSQSGNGILSLRRLSLDGMSKPSHKSATDLLGLRPGMRTSSADDNSLLVQRTKISTLLERGKSLSHGARSQSLPVPGSRSASPNKGSVSNSSVSRGVSPSRAKTPSPVSSRGPSPSRSRPSSPLRQSSPPSVLSFITDIRKGKKAASHTHIEDVHQLRLLYNRHLQWRYANAQVDVTQHAQTEKAEITLYSAWRTTSVMWKSLVEKRMKLQQMRLYFKLCSVVNPQVIRYLDEWALIERDHTESLLLAIKDLLASTFRLPLTGGARGDTLTVKAALCSALDVMLAMGSSIGVILSQMEKTNSLASEVAKVAAQEKNMLDECEALLGSTVAMQVEEYTQRVHVIQAWRSE